MRRGDRRRDREGRRGRRRGPRSVVASRGGRRASRVATTTTTTTTTMEELGGVAGAPPPPTPTPRDVPLMRPGDVVLLDMNGEKWAFINLKRARVRARPSLRPRARRSLRPPPPPPTTRRRSIIQIRRPSRRHPSVRPSVVGLSLLSLRADDALSHAPSSPSPPPSPSPPALAAPRAWASIARCRSTRSSTSPFGGAYEVDQARPHLFTPVPVRPRRRGERDSLRTLSPGVLFASLRARLAFDPDAPRPTPFNSVSDAFRLHI